MHPSAILILCLALTASSVHARTLTQEDCSAFSSARATGGSNSAQVKAVTEAFAQCTGGDDQCKGDSGFDGSKCDAYAEAAARAEAKLVAEAVTSAFASVNSKNPDCLASAEALSSAKTVARGLATSIANSIAQGCNQPAVTEQSKKIEEVFVTATSDSQAFAKTQGVGNAEAWNDAFAKTVQPIIAESLSLALATCDCGQGGSGTLTDTGNTTPPPPATSTTGSTSNANTNGGPNSNQDAGAQGRGATGTQRCVTSSSGRTVCTGGK